MPISVQSKEDEKNDPGSGSALTTLLSVRKLSDVPRYVFVVLGCIALLLLIDRKGGKPNILPSTGQ